MPQAILTHSLQGQCFCRIFKVWSQLVFAEIIFKLRSRLCRSLKWNQNWDTEIFDYLSWLHRGLLDKSVTEVPNGDVRCVNRHHVPLFLRNIVYRFIVTHFQAISFSHSSMLSDQHTLITCLYPIFCRENVCLTDVDDVDASCDANVCGGSRSAWQSTLKYSLLIRCCLQQLYIHTNKLCIGGRLLRWRGRRYDRQQRYRRSM